MLKDCPFCGGKAEVYEYEYEGQIFFAAGCSKCMVTTQGSDVESEVIEIWNKRIDDKTKDNSPCKSFVV